MYSVISPKKEYYGAYEKFFIAYKKYPYEIIIKENGQAGDHPHLNIIWSDTVSKRTQDLTGLLKKHMLKANLEGVDSPVLVRTRKITHLDGLLGGYLQKEDNYEILYDSKKYNLEELKKKYCRPSKGFLDVRWNDIVSYSTAPLVIIKFCEQNDIDYLARTTSTGVNPNTGKKIYSISSKLVVRLLMQIQKMYNIQVHHLFKKAQEIHLAVLAHYSVWDEVDLTFM